MLPKTGIMWTLLYSIDPACVLSIIKAILYLSIRNTQIPLKIFKLSTVKQAWTGPEGSRKLKLPDFVTTAQDGGRLSALRTGRLYPPRKYSWYSFLLEAESTPRAIVRSEGFYVNEKSSDISWNRTSDLPICSTAPSPLLPRSPSYLLHLLI